MTITTVLHSRAAPSHFQFLKTLPVASLNACIFIGVFKKSMAPDVAPDSGLDAALLSLLEVSNMDCARSKLWDAVAKA